MVIKHDVYKALYWTECSVVRRGSQTGLPPASWDSYVTVVVECSVMILFHWP